MVKKSLRSYCAEAVRNEDRDRFLCAMFAPPRHREALFALYAFNLEIARIRETVTEPLIGQMRLQWWRDTVTSIQDGQVPHHPVAEALAETFKKYNLTLRHFDRLLNAREFDLTDDLPTNMVAFIEYAEATSVPLIQLSLEVLGVTEESAHKTANDAGTAWALTGLLRSLPALAAAGRFFVPQDVCQRLGKQAHELVALPASAELKIFVADVSEVVHERIRLARKSQPYIARQAVPALLPITMADDYLRLLKRADYDPFAARLGRLSPAGMFRLIINGFRGSY
ncbi:MAG: phytoene/squalene synthase family protein [Rhodospirillaceae bacterium]|jgi:NADH dehydrogenase [ubiquinone] 1 alpha subcomplex assembly factor 6